MNESKRLKRRRSIETKIAVGKNRIRTFIDELDGHSCAGENTTPCPRWRALSRMGQSLGESLSRLRASLLDN